MICLHIHNIDIVKTLLGSPKGPIELGHPNTCAEVKAVFIFIHVGPKTNLPQD